MVNDKVKSKRITTAALPVVFAWLDKPSTKFNEDGVYEVSVLMDKDAANALETELKDAFTEARKGFLEDPKANKKNSKGKLRKDYELALPIRPDRDEEGNDTGSFIFKAKMPAKFKKDDGEEVHLKVPIFDAAGEKITPKVGRGSKVRVCFDARPFVMDATSTWGVSARLRAVQVIDLVEFGDGSSDSFGFSKEDKPKSSKPAEDTESDDDADDSPF